MTVLSAIPCQMSLGVEMLDVFDSCWPTTCPRLRIHGNLTEGIISQLSSVTDLQTLTESHPKGAGTSRHRDLCPGNDAFPVRAPLQGGKKDNWGDLPFLPRKRSILHMSSRDSTVESLPDTVSHTAAWGWRWGKRITPQRNSRLLPCSNYKLNTESRSVRK